ncbi:MAG TPA: lysylphosphatidylglycerol synthase transmembrane domain-containing protein [Solirubrobacterales bacterium]|nr:lysylphosphatidylglycerol synthase transmembrane domain-containing protein [Solirubrobacterales bacterium]
MSQEDSAQEDGRFGEMPIFTTRRIVQTLVLVFILLGAIYFLFPKLVGLGDALGRLDDADPLWIAIAVAFNVAAYATYIALFKAVVGGDALRLSWNETYEINMAGVAATLLFSAGGAGGVALTYWALRKAGMARRDVGRRMVAFVSLHYVFYPFALILFGILLRTGVMNGKGSVELTIVPAAVAGLLLILGVLITLIPADAEERLARYAHSERSQHLLQTLGKVPATLGEGFRFALGLFTHPSRGGLAVLGAAGFWAFSIGVLWASFHAFGVHVPLAVVVQGFFLGMVANLFPLAPAGVGAVDAGMIGAFVLFGFPSETVFPAILIFRLVSFWMPIPPGIFAFFQLRHTVHRWEEEGLPIDRGGSAAREFEEVVDALPPAFPGATIKSKVIDSRRREND